MVAKTKFSIDVKFDNKVPVKYVPMKSIQKGSAKGSTGVSVTDASWSFLSLTVKWEELTDPINKMVTLSIKEVSIAVLFKCAIQYAREIDKKSKCHAHIVKHEKLHVDSRKANLKKNTKVMIKYIEQATAPKMDKPLTIKLSKAKALRASSWNKIKIATQEACGKIMTHSNNESSKIDTPTAGKTTTDLCKEFI